MRSVTREESLDTGLALVLLLLILQLALRQQWLVTGAVALLVLTMTAPRVFAPAAVVWLGLAHRLGLLLSWVLLSAVFALVVTPIGLVRRWLGHDPLHLRRFKDGRESVMRPRQHTFSAGDLEKPY